jgi:hypothetical protein
MITIFGDFRQFPAKKLAFFLKKQCYNHFFAKTIIRAKSANIFAKIFGENILTIITSVPGEPTKMNLKKELIYF